MSKSLHICLLSRGDIFGAPYGGEDRFTISLGNWLAREGHDVTIMGIKSGLKMRRLSRLTVDDENKKKFVVKRRKYRSAIYRYLDHALRYLISLIWVLKILFINIKTPLTLVHAQDTGHTGLAAIASCKLLRIPSVISSHGIRHQILEHGAREADVPEILKKIMFKIEYKIDTYTINNASNVIAVNPSIKKYFEQITSKRIDVIPIPIKSRNFKFSALNRDLIRKQLGIDNQMTVIGFVGRLMPEKNLFTLLSSFADIAQYDASVRLILVGEGPQEFQLKEYVNKRAIEGKVIFFGLREDIGKILSSFDIFVLASYTEGLSTALLEAMACGKAIVCSDIPANRQLLTNNQEALFIDPYNKEELTKAIQLLLSDKPLRSKLGFAAETIASKYDENMVFPKILQYYETLLLTNGKKINDK